MYISIYIYVYGSIYAYGAEHLHYTQFYPFYAASSIIIPSIYLPNKVSYLTYYMIVETLKVLILLSLMLAFTVPNPESEISSLSSSHSISFTFFHIICSLYTHIILTYFPLFPNNYHILSTFPKLFPHNFHKPKFNV